MNRPLSALIDDIALPSHRLVVAHWLDLYAANGNRVPLLRELDPIRFPAALRDIWIVDADDDGRFRFHLAGQSLVEWYGSSPKGLAMEDIYPDTVLPLINRTLRRIIEAPAICYQKGSSLTKSWSLPIAMERVGLPLGDETGRLRHLFGITSLETRDGDGDGPLTSRIDVERWYPVAA